VVYPLNGMLTCSDPPPTISWTPEGYTRYRVFISWTPQFVSKTSVNSGDTLLKTTYWNVPPKKWAKACSNAAANGMLYFRVYGRNKITNMAEWSEVSPVQVW
jgi:hypothetical protein